MRCCIFASVLAIGCGHGDLVWPTPRNNKGCRRVQDPGIYQGNYGNAIEWYSHFCGIDMDQCDPSMGNGQYDSDKSRHPGSDPGRAPMLHPCSAFCTLDSNYRCTFTPFDGGNNCGSTKWVVNETVEVMTAINNNHHGYYQFRLCPVHDNDYAGIKESDCAKHVIEFASNQIGIKPRYAGKELPGDAPTTYIAAIDRTGSVDGSAWRDMSQMEEDSTIYVDKLRVPNLPDGEYVLQWRWDCIQTAQVWSSCSDIQLYSSPPPPSPNPPSPAGCHAISPQATDDWCANNCAAGFCPSNLCSCAYSVLL